MSATGGLSREAYLGVGTPLILLCAGFVGVRCTMVLRQHKRLLVDDYLSIVGLLFVTVSFALNDVIIRRFLDPTASLVWLVQIAVVITVIIAFALWTSKAPILVVYIRIFGINRWLAYICYATLVLTGLLYIGAMVPTFLRCRPNADPMTPMELGTCVTGTTLTGVISGFVALAIDILIFFLPMPSIYGLHLPLAKKLQVAFVFFSGIFGIVASIISLYYKWRAYNGEVSDTLATMLCAVVEGTIAIIIGCAPAAKAFWSTVLFPRYSTVADASMYPNPSRTKRSLPHSVSAVASTYSSGDTYVLMESQAGSQTGEPARADPKSSR